jgi:hypothetical protein
VRDAESRFANSTQAGARAWRRLPVVAVLLAIASLTVGASSASAAYTHIPGPEFGSDGSAAGSFPCCVRSLAYQQASKRLYVANDSKIFGLDLSVPGTYTPLTGGFPFNNTLFPFGEIGVDNSFTASAGNIYSAQDSSTVSGYNSSGTALPGWPVNVSGSSCGVTADSEGYVWASTEGSQGARKFNPTGGASIGSFSRSPEAATGVCRIAIDASNDDIYLSGYSESTPAQVIRYTKASNYATSEKLVNNPFKNAPIAVNGVNHRIYIGSETVGEIVALSTITGNVVETIQVGSGIRDLAVNEAEDALYVLRFGTQRVQEYRATGGPKAATGAPTAPKSTTVTGVADPNGNGPITECYFVFGKSASTLSKKNCDQSLPISSSQAVTATLPGIEGEHVYGYRLVVSNGEPGAVASGIYKTLLLHNVEGLGNDPATEVKRKSAKFNAHFEGTNEETTYYFEYGETTAYGSRFPTGTGELSAGKTTGNTPISAVVPGLKPQTKYHYRVIANNPKGTSVSSGDIEFETPPAVASVSTDEATEITQTTAILNGSYNASTVDSAFYTPENTVYYFEWGTTTSYGHDTAPPPGADAGIHEGIIHVSAQITGLTKYVPTTPTPYHYRIVVSNGYGTTYGPDRTFHSAPADPPSIAGAGATGVTPTEASISASINPNGAPTTYVVEYGTDSSYGTTTLEGDSIGEDESDHPVGATLEGLSSGTTYHYRVVATNFGGTSYSPDQTFTTPATPGIESSDASLVGETTAHLSALVSAHLSPTVVNFQYGSTAAYGASTSPSSIGSSFLAQNVGADIGGLAPGTTYHFRVVAGNGIGTATGPDLAFTTRPVPPHEEKKPTRCPKGKVRRHGKCVKPHRKTHRKHAGGRRNG